MTTKDYVQTWRHDLAHFLERVASLDGPQRAAEAFQRELWDANPVSGVGQGAIDVSAAIAEAGFRDWLATRSLEPVPEGSTERQAHFEAIYQALIDRLEPHCSNRIPRLKIFRVLAALFPQHFTCVTHRTKAAKLAKRLTGASHGEVQRHLIIRQRLDAALGPPDPGWDALAQRMTLPWFLYESADDTPSEERTTAGGIPEQTRLVPLPPARRRRSLTSFGGGLNLLLACLEVAKDGVSRDDLRAFLKGQNPKLKDSSLGTIIYTLQFELGALKHTGDSWYHTGDLYLPPRFCKCALSATTRKKGSD